MEVCRMLDASMALHLANRLGYGPAPGSLARIQARGFDGYLDEQLNPRLDQLPATLSAVLSRLPSHGKNTSELYQDYWWRLLAPEKGTKVPFEQKRLLKKVMAQVTDEARTARLVRSIASPWQLQEALVEFWFNHFNVYEHKGPSRIWIGAYEDEAIRPHTLGRFSDLLLATAKHPVMLIYLDNDRNVAPTDAPASQPSGKGKAVGINENYAREVMELHTLGVDGGYTQSDVVALAHILTGWGLGLRARDPANVGFHFVPQRHDASPQILLGRKFSGGQEEGEAALLMLAHHPSTARHISFKLAQYFVADQPPPDLVAQMAREFQRTDGDLKAVTKLMLTSKAFRDPGNFGRKFKTPYQFVVSAARVTDFDINNVLPLTAALRLLGQPLYDCVTPDGYGCTESTWLDPDAMMRRINFAVAFGSGKFGAAHLQDHGAEATPIDGEKLVAALGPEITSKTRTALQKTAKPLWASAIIGSPEFMRC
jgi:uncharacterized protein (DUF1800 family)